MDTRKIKRYKWTIAYVAFLLLVPVPITVLAVAALWKYVTS